MLVDDDQQHTSRKVVPWQQQYIQDMTCESVIKRVCVVKRLRDSSDDYICAIRRLSIDWTQLCNSETLYNEMVRILSHIAIMAAKRAAGSGHTHTCNIIAFDDDVVSLRESMLERISSDHPQPMSDLERINNNEIQINIILIKQVDSTTQPLLCDKLIKMRETNIPSTDNPTFILTLCSNLANDNPRSPPALINGAKVYSAFSENLVLTALDEYLENDIESRESE